MPIMKKSKATKNSWLTGTASWTFLSISQAILGILPEYDGLRIAPCIPDEWKELTVCRIFRGVRYEIHIENTGTYSLTANGKAVDGNILPLYPEGTAVKVRVTV